MSNFELLITSKRLFDNSQKLVAIYREIEKKASSLKQQKDVA